MNRKSFYIFCLFIGIWMIAAWCCKPEKIRVFYVNSYHPGYPPSDEVMMAIQDHLPKDSFDLKIFFLDSKRNPESKVITEKVQAIIKELENIPPGLLMVSDDNALKYLVEPNLKKFKYPIVFCGINWSLARYNLPLETITGILEVLPLHESLQLIKRNYPGVKYLTILSENSLSEQNNKILLDTLFKNEGLIPRYVLVNQFEEWKKAFLEAMDSADVVYLPTNGGIRDWNREQAIQFAENNISRPVFTCDDFMMDYCVFGLTKVAYEQGEWAAETAKNILNGTDPKLIPVSRNKEVKSWLNPVLAEKIGFVGDSTYQFTLVKKDNK